VKINSRMFACFVCLLKLQNGKSVGNWFIRWSIERLAHYSLHNVGVCWKFLPERFTQTEANCGERLFVVETEVAVSKTGHVCLRLSPAACKALIYLLIPSKCISLQIFLWRVPHFVSSIPSVWWNDYWWISGNLIII